MPEYAYLYRGGRPPESPEQAQQVMQKWIAWMKDLAERGHMVDRGQPLERSGKIVQSANKSIIDGPFAEAKDVIGGFTLVRAKDITEASELARGCPILERGGHVEVRPIMQMNM